MVQRLPIETLPSWEEIFSGWRTHCSIHFALVVEVSFHTFRDHQHSYSYIVAISLWNLGSWCLQVPNISLDLLMMCRKFRRPFMCCNLKIVTRSCWQSLQSQSVNDLLQLREVAFQRMENSHCARISNGFGFIEHKNMTKVGTYLVSDMGLTQPLQFCFPGPRDDR